jgi:hypothetical protein
MWKSAIGWFALLLLIWVSARYPAPAGSFPDQLELSEIRYRKGMELIRLLYEKILSLDHHFTAMRTGQLVESLCNPTAYEDVRAYLAGQEKQRAKRGPGFGFENPYLAAAYLGAERQLAQGARQEELDDLACLIDFSLRIHADLHLILYETAFLLRSNEQLELECRELFTDYVAAIGYPQSLEDCRKNDDWEAVFRQLESHIQGMRRRMESKDPKDQERLLRDHVNLEFAVDRLLNFIRNYQAHIQRGSHYYFKFHLILEQRQPRPSCADRLPPAWGLLKGEIAQSIESFHQAYQVAEFKGSRMKDLLYGFSD